MNRITHSQLLELLHYCPRTGNFTWLKDRGRTAKAGQRAGSRHKHGYIVTRLNGKHYLMHRLAWFYVYKEWPNMIDHIDQNRANNSISNLRDVSNQENAFNRGANRNSQSGYKCLIPWSLTVRGKTYRYRQVKIAHNGGLFQKNFNIEKYDEEYVVEFCNKKLKELHGEFAHQNFYIKDQLWTGER